MATEFTATVKSSGGDYTTLSAAEAGLQDDLTAATIKVFSISAASTPTIAAGDTVLGQTSAATGVCVLVNAARTQILIKTIAVAAFQSGEVVQKTTDAAVNVTLSNAGDSPIVGIACYPVNDTTAVTFAGWTTSATNYIYVYTPAGQRHAGVWDGTKYNLTSALTCLTISEAFIRFDGIQIDFTYTAGSTRGGILIDLVGTAAYSSTDYRISNCIVRKTGAATGTVYGIYFISDPAVANAVAYLWNNIIYDFASSGASGVRLSEADVTINAYNNTVYGCDYNYRQTAGTFVAKNCGSAAHVTADFNGTITQTTCSSTTPTFANEGARDLRLASSDTTWHDQGTDNPGSGLFLDDIAGQTRVSVWDIGAYEYLSGVTTSRAGTLSLLGIGI